MDAHKKKSIAKAVVGNILYSSWILLLGIGILFLLITQPNELLVAGLCMFWVSPYFIPAITTKDKKYWITAGVVLLLMLTLGVCGMYIGPETGTPYQILDLIKNVYILGLLIYALANRKEIVTISNYVHSDEYRYAKGMKEKEKKKDAIHAMLKRNNSDATPMKEEKKEPLVTQNTDKIDINTCTEKDYLRLPGMNIAAAKKAIQNRMEHGAYLSVDDFVQRNQIKPHFMIQMEPMINVGEIQVEENRNVKKGRMLDL